MKELERHNSCILSCSKMAVLKVYRALLITIILILIVSCKQVTKVTDIITQPSAREVYERDFKEDTLLFARWQDAFSRAIKDSVSIKLPYLEQGHFLKNRTEALGYDLSLEQGEILHVVVDRKSIEIPVFLDLFEKKTNSSQTRKPIKANKLNADAFQYTVEKTGDYTLIVQPGMGAQGLYDLKVYRKPLYHFPVTGKGNAAIQSFWGARREGGRRSHEGLDIFADRGTPVVAAADGWVSSTGNRGLGGKQVWMRAGLFGNSMYYAHLDSIAVTSGKRVKVGDTLGFVGNTGNARTTPPHLHFGIYQGRKGAVNPFPYVFEGKAPLPPDPAVDLPVKVVVKAERANLRASAFLPSGRHGAKAKQLGHKREGDTLTVLGKTQQWLHVRTAEGQAAYIFESLTTAIKQ